MITALDYIYSLGWFPGLKINLFCRKCLSYLYILKYCSEVERFYLYSDEMQFNYYESIKILCFVVYIYWP